jgi:hypothetical protein
MDALSCNFLSLDPRTSETDQAPEVTIDVPICDQFGTIYQSVRDAARTTGVARYYIEQQLSGKDKGSARGFLFSFAGVRQ